jgi:predicted PurR-regulated permease PerM
MQTVVSYIGMTALGLDNALFWALVIFILNYIPIVGGLAAVALPVMFALVQFESLGRVGILAGILFGAQFVIGNTIQPKMMGDSMNLSALVVILALSVWGALWGGVGAFLSAPLTVIIMIILAQFPTTRWIAVLLSADGNPDIDGDGEPDPAPMPSL